jgi:sterol desaturase/sphingolipid hydroxylase (fatty acid hydroxylase superfamily)
MDRSPTLVSLTIGLLILSAAFWLVERWRPSLPAQRRDWRQTWTDLAYWFFTPLVTRVATRIALGVVFALVALSQGLTLDELRRVATTRQTWASTLPVWTQIPMVMLLADLMAYWTHRLFHGRTLWSFHAIHHSSRTVDWLSSVRLHPVNDVVSRIVQVLPLYWMGFNAGVLAGFVPFLTLYALLLHANVSWTYGRLRLLIASPTFHRWHHTSEEEGLDKNFAGLFPFIDLAFGTFYMPPGRQPQRFGIVNDDVPDGLLAQLAYPFGFRSFRTSRLLMWAQRTRMKSE